MLLIVLVLSLVTKNIVLGDYVVIEADTNQTLDKFPDDFLFGTATAAYQIEGAWNTDGKGPSIWDTFTHEHPELIADKSNGDIGPDSYHLFESDLKLIKNLKLNIYRFSISWTRILPNGDPSSLNQAGIDYYNHVINSLIENGVQPMVTMYHWDLPEELQKIGGLANPLFIHYFKEYSNVLYSHFGDRVKYWITFNEPHDYCIPGYGLGTTAPLVHSSGVGEYLCIDHTLKAHALAYRLYKSNYYEKYHGKIGITISSRFFYSKINDSEIINRAMQFGLGWVTHPIFSHSGGYPEVMIQEIARNSLREGRKWSRLPNMNNYWKRTIKGAADFLGLNYYSSRYVEYAEPPEGENPSNYRDSRMKYSVDPKWKQAKSSWLYYVPDGLGGLLRWVKDEYDNVEVFITENGWSDDGQQHDIDRANYLKDHLKEVLKAIKKYGCNITGYTFWSLIDNFEWLEGYTEKFGLHAVNYSSPTKERIPKFSASVYKQIIEEGKIPA